MRRCVMMLMCVGLVACSQDLSSVDATKWAVEDGAKLPEAVLPPDGDADGDGLTNAEEEALGLDPNNPSSFGDGVLDSERLVASCEDLMPPEFEFSQAVGAYWHALFSPELELDWIGQEGFFEVHAFSSSTHGVASALIDPLTSLEHRPIQEVFESLYGARTVSSQSEPSHDIWEGSIYFPEAITLGEARARVLEELIGESYPIELSLDSTEPTRAFGARFTRVRFGDDMLTLLAVYEQDALEREGTYRIVRDSTSHLNLTLPGQAYTIDYRCHPFNVRSELTGVDLYMVLDQSGSMDSYNEVITRFAQEFSRKLAYSGIDTRFGVTNMSPDFAGELREEVGWHTDPGTLVREINDYVINCRECSSFEEYGLFVAEQGILAMKDPSKPASQRIRPSARLVTLFMTDEDANSIEDGKRPDSPDESYTSEALLAKYEAFFTEHTTAYTLYQDEEVCDAFLSGGEGYASVALATGGRAASLCDPDLTVFFDQIIEDIKPQEQVYELPATPIPSSLRVTTLDDEGDIVRIPRNVVDGYDYDPVRNTIAFFGRYKPRSSSGYSCSEASESVCPASERCVSGECVRDGAFEVVVQAMFHP